jgi:hypothetical protein
MRLIARLWAMVLAGLFVVAVVSPAGAAQQRKDIVDQLKAVPGLTVVDEAKAPEGYRFFHLTFTQPADHRNPGAGKFEQRLTLLHRNESRPMIMFTGGYNVNQSPRISEPAKIVDGNQLSMEYRYFPPSIPAKTNWTKQLTIWQAAADEHRIISVFKSIYQAHWLSTGGSKGGMTATYHRRFFPNDVDGTIPYVAPNDVVDSDDVYDKFLNKVGSKQCRTDLKRFQRESLQRRGELTTLAAAEAKEKKLTFETVGSLDKSLETSVIDSYFGFWQYQPVSECANIPPAGAPAKDMYAFYDKVESLLSYADQELTPYTAYYFQAAYQLGAPEAYDSYLRDLLRYPGFDVPQSFIPRDIRPKHFDDKAMPDIDKWVRTSSSRMLYVYGSFDPWSAEPFSCGHSAQQRDCHRYYVPGGNHGSNIAALPPKQRAEATALVLKWAGVAPDTARAKVANDPAFPEFESNQLMLDRPRL